MNVYIVIAENLQVKRPFVLSVFNMEYKALLCIRRNKRVDERNTVFTYKYYILKEQVF